MIPRPQYAREIKSALTDARAVCERLGLIAGPRSFLRQASGVIVRCPWHEEKTPSCSIRRASDGTIAVRCHGCDATGDVLSLIAVVHGLSTKTDFKRVLIAGAELAGLWAVVHEIETGSAPAEDRPRPLARPIPVADERTYPPATDVAAVWNAAIPVAADVEASRWFAGRGIDPERIADDVARVVAPTDRLPRWAAYQGSSWTRTGHRLIVPMRGPSGAILSVRGARLGEGETPKRLPPGGHKASGLVMANDFAVAMLEGRLAPRRVLVVEGEPDFFEAVTWRMPVPTACIGLVSGAWSPLFAQRVPVGTEVLVWTDIDAAGDRYAAEVARSLHLSRGCAVSRWSPKEVA